VWQVAGSAALRIPPLFNLPSWVIDRGNNDRSFSQLPPAKAVAFAAVWLRARRKTVEGKVATEIEVLDRVDKSKDPWSRLV
jgi:hypothetical protein